MTDVPFDPETGEILDQPAQPATPAVQPQPAAPAPTPRTRRNRKKQRSNGRAPIPENESPRQRFERVADGRVKAVIKAIRVLKKLGRNQGSYDYTEEDIEFMFERLSAELDELRAAMKPREKEGQVDFSFRR